MYSDGYRGDGVDESYQGAGSRTAQERRRNRPPRWKKRKATPDQGEQTMLTLQPD